MVDVLHDLVVEPESHNENEEAYGTQFLAKLDINKRATKLYNITVNQKSGRNKQLVDLLHSIRQSISYKQCLLA